MSGLKSADVINAIEIVTKQWQEDEDVIRIVNDYDLDNVSKKVVRIIISYIDYINRTVWKQY